MARFLVATAEQAFEHFIVAHARQADRSRPVYAYPDYGAMRNDAACKAFNRRLEDAEAMGAIQLKWQRHGQYLEWIRLADLSALYAFLGRNPPGADELSPLAAAILDLACPTSGEERTGWMEIATALDGDWPMPMAGALVAELKRIRSEPPDRPAFIIAASGPLASSKLLDRLPRAALRRIEVPIDAYPPPPMVLLTAGAARPEAVVLVENPRAFEQAFAATRDLPVAWVSTHGLVVTSLADGLRNRHYGAPVDGAPPPLGRLLAMERLFYWGDLDQAGLMIFLEARKRLPHLCLSALYRPMLDLLTQGGGHPYVNVTDKAGQRPCHTDDALVSSLLCVCSGRAVDQEFVTQAQIRDNCLSVLTSIDCDACGSAGRGTTSA